MCVSGAGRGRMALIWLAAVILELSSRSRPPAERGRAPVEQGREGGRLAGPLRAGDLGLWGEMGLKVWYYSTVERERADKAGVWSCPQSFPSVGIPVPLTVWVTVFLFLTNTHIGARWQLRDHMLRKTLEGVFTHTWVLLKLWALLHARDWFFFSCYIKNLSEMTYHSFICFATFKKIYIYLQIL